MGNLISTPETTLILQTGKMRAKFIDSGVDCFNIEEQLPENTVHRFLPNYLEGKYEAIDFCEKFGLTERTFNIYNGIGNLVSLKNEGNELLLDNVGVVCSIGSSSLQAFKIFPGGVSKPILPISKDIIEDGDILGDKNNPILSLDSLCNFGSSSKDVTITRTILGFLEENSTDCNVIFVNAIGYSTLGFNPRPFEGVINELVPKDEEKIIKLNTPSFKWNDNKGKTALIHVLAEFAKDNMFLVTRQVKVATENGTQELSGQWANQGHLLINEPELKLTDYSINTIVDLGGGSGTIYERVERSVINTFGILFELPFESSEKLSKEFSPNKILSSMEDKGFEEVRKYLFEGLTKEFENINL